MSKKDFKEKIVEKITDITVGCGILIFAGLFIAAQFKNPHQKEKDITTAFYQNKIICCDHTPIINDETKPLIKLFVEDGKLFVSDELGKKYDAASCEVFKHKEICELR